MVENNIGTRFGLQHKEEGVYESYIGDWVTVSLQNGHSSSGVLKDIKQGHLLLNPYQGFVYNEQGHMVRQIIELNKPEALPTIAIQGIQSILRETVENYCEKANRDFVRENTLKELEFKKIVEQQKPGDKYVDGAGI